MALEGAQLKEISYIHAEGCAFAAMKHAFIAMIDKRFPTVCLATKDMMYDKVISNMQEIKSRGGKMIAIATEGDEEIAEVADDVIYTPQNLDFMPIPAAVALQLFAYYCAIERGCDIDQPRNLAKSVTVEYPGLSSSSLPLGGLCEGSQMISRRFQLRHLLQANLDYQDGTDRYQVLVR